ncbi:MAG: glycosyltransferase family 4 protein [Pirellulaceae bacterium]
MTSGDRTPSTRFRVLPFLSHLTKGGICCRVASSFPQKYDYFPWMGFRPSQMLKRVVRHGHLAWSRVRPVDVVFIERELFDNDSWDMEDRFRRSAARVVLDLDDAVFLRYPEKMDRLARQADVVIAGNPWIARWAHERTDRCVVIPTGVELARFPVRPLFVTHREPVIGWIGTTGNLAYLEAVAPALRALARRHAYELRIVAPEWKLPPAVDLTGVRVRYIPWHPDREVQELHQFDIGIMPLFRDREWDRYKCPTKLIQYMSIGIPAVATPTGFTGEVLTHGSDGFYAADAKQWEDHLANLLVDESLRRRVGLIARRTVAEKYCVETNWPLLAAALRGEPHEPWNSFSLSDLGVMSHPEPLHVAAASLHI